RETKMTRQNPVRETSGLRANAAASDQQEAFIRFQMPIKTVGTTTPILAVLKLFIKSGPPVTLNVYAANNNWSAATMTWNGSGGSNTPRPT
ncbi:MAG TPA: hypothetical protein PKX00_06115, partial [Opitutaceae bacterium]|nr:hypothetical protein [Opitutaceae bacterium]